ncbi:MAG: adenylate/guanylate cyclase domain-containing protein [Bacteroidota bacterium]
MSKTRRLAAIMFTDIAGYTAMMQEDEARALTARERHREVFKRTHAAFNGKILQYYGDGTLSIFDSAIDAANCAVAIQQELQEEPTVPLRIGIHTGDIVYTEEEAIGDGVNVASRIESLAVPGSIMISEKVYDYIKNQLSLPVQSMGIFTFKNVQSPIQVYALAHKGLEVPNPEQLSGKFEKRVSATSPKTFFQRIPVWAKFVGGFLLFLLLAPIIYSPFLQQSVQASQDTITVEDENGNILEQKAILFEDMKTFIMAPFRQTQPDSANQWLSMGIPYGLEMEWDQDPYIWHTYYESDRLKPFNEYLEEAEREELAYVLMGEYEVDTENEIQLTLSFYESSNGQLAYKMSYSGKELFPLLDSVSRDAKLILGIPEAHLQEVKDLPLDQYLTSNLKTYESFCKALLISKQNRNLGFKALSEVLEQDSTFAWAHYLLGRNHHLYQRSVLRANYHIDQAMRYRSRMPGIFEADIRRMNYRIKGEPEKALKLTEMMAQLYPRNSIYQFDLIGEYMLQNHYEAALEKIRNYQKIFGEPFAEADKEASCLIFLNREQEGIRRAEEFMKANPNIPQVHFSLGEFQINLGNWEKARESYDKMALLAPDNYVIPLMLSHVDFMQDSSHLVNEALYQEFDGWYRTPFSKFEVQILEQNGKLYSQVKNQSRTSLYPLSTHQYISPWGLGFQFVANELGYIEKVYCQDGPVDNFTLYKISPDIQQGIDALMVGKLAAAKTFLESAQKQYPTHPIVEDYLAHIAFRNSPKYQPQSFEKWVGTYKTSNYLYTLYMKGDQLYLQSEENTRFIDPVHLFPLSPRKFVLTNSIKYYIEFDPKRKGLIITYIDGSQTVFEKV